MPKIHNQNGERKSKKRKVETESNENNDESQVTKQNKLKEKEVITWPDSDILELINNIQKNIPQDDSVSYGCRIEKINWKSVVFKKHSVQECKQVWSLLLKQVRKYRLLQEIITDMKTWVETPKRTSGRKVLRHPDKPKQPLNSFMLFVRKKRHEVMNKDQDLTSIEVSRKLGMMFKDLPIKTKEKYRRKARIAREEYIEKLKNFYKEHPDQIPKRRSRSKAVQFEDGSGPPKKPKTPFQLFVQVESEKDNTEDHREQNYRIIWNEMNDKEKFFWINWAQEQYNEYVKQLKNYLKIQPNYEPGKIKILSKKEREIRDLQLGKPEKPPRSAYHLFTKMIMEAEDMRKINHKEAINYISEKWKACPEDEKNEYKVRVDQMWEEYRKQLDEFILSLPPQERNQVKVVNMRKLMEPKKKTTNKVEKVKLTQPLRPPLTEYKYFLSVYKGKENPSVIWDNMIDDEKLEYEQKLVELRNDYIKSYEQYLRSLSREELEKVGSENRRIEESSDSESVTSEEEN